MIAEAVAVATNEVGGCGNPAVITTIPAMNSEHGALPYRGRRVIVRAGSGAQGVAVHPRFRRGPPQNNPGWIQRPFGCG